MCPYNRDGLTIEVHLGLYQRRTTRKYIYDGVHGIILSGASDHLARKLSEHMHDYHFVFQFMFHTYTNLGLSLSCNSATTVVTMV